MVKTKKSNNNRKVMYLGLIFFLSLVVVYLWASRDNHRVISQNFDNPKKQKFPSKRTFHKDEEDEDEDEDLIENDDDEIIPIKQQNILHEIDHSEGLIPQIKDLIENMKSFHNGEKPYRFDDFSAECKELFLNGGYVKNGKKFVSQYEQDFAMFHSFFRNWDKPGFYVDVGAFHPKQFSNTYFLDVCLGWKGICIEANPMNLKKFKNSERSCKVVPMCVTDSRRKVKFTGVSSGGYVNDANPKADGIEVQCDTLKRILDDNQVFDVDFMSIDIEGSEYKALRAFPFRDYNIRLIEIEIDNRLNKQLKKMRDLFENAGYWNIGRIKSDYFYIRGFNFVHDSSEEE